MADEPLTNPLALDPVPDEDAGPRLRPRRMRLDADTATAITRMVDDAITERQEWLNKRMERYAKFRGWTQRESPPWDGCCFVPGTDLLTRDGWVPVEKIDVGTEVFSRNPQAGEAGFIPVRLTWEFQRTDRAARIFTPRGVDITVTPEHRIYLVDEREGRYPNRHRLTPIRELVGQPIRHWEIPMTAEYAGGDLPALPEGVDPGDWYELWGWYLADGSWDRSGHSRICIAQSRTANPDKLERIIALTSRLGFSYSVIEGRTAAEVRIHVGPQWRTAFAATGESATKYIPRPLLDGPKSALLRLLDALMAGDGHTSWDGHRRYATVSKQLADDVQELFARTGTWARMQHIYHPPSTIEGRPIPGCWFWSVGEHRGKTLRLAADGSSVGWVDYTGPNYCVTTDWGVVYARMNGCPLFIGQSNHHYPAMMANELRVEAGLFNAVMGIRPMMEPKVRRDLKDRADIANGLIDYQLFVEHDGEQFVQKYIAQFCKDPCVFSFQPWVKHSSRLTDVRVLPRTEQPLIELMAEQIQALYPSVTELVAHNDAGTRWSGRFLDDGREADVEFTVWAKGEDQLELVATWEAVVFDGPVALVEDLEDVVIPMRCENPQPVTPQNPKGAPWVARLSRVTLDELRRGQQAGIYDLIRDDDWKDIEGAAGGRIPSSDDTDDDLKRQKDVAAGLDQQGPHDYDRQWLTLVQWFGARDVDDDGLQEEVILWVIKETGHTIRAKHLTEMYPGMPPRRPVSHTCYIPVEGQIYGVSLLEVMEGLHDFLHIMLNQMTDNGDLANRPFGFYRASSGMKSEVIRMWPGDLYPIDNPLQDVHFPQMPHADQTFGFNMVGLAKQFMDDVTQIGPLQRGQIQQGKASALRTAGTTMAILQQGAAMPEQVLRRLFMGLRQVWEQFHLLNGRFLPKRKQYLATGQLEQHEDPYREIADPMDVAIPIAWDWQPTLLNTNKGLVQQALQAIGMAVFNPLSLQMGTVGPQQYYNWQADLIKASTLDPARYIKKPPGVTDGPRLTAEDAALAIMEGHPPVGSPMEEPQEHLAKFQQLMAEMAKSADADGVGLPQLQDALAQSYIAQVTILVQQAQQAQQLAAAAQQFSSALGNEGQGQGSQPTGEVPPMQTEAPSADEIAGASG